MLKTDPDSRRNIVSAWNVGEIRRWRCRRAHAFFQFYVADGRLSCQLYQRSADLFLGVPFNIASYALLTHMMAAQAGLDVGEFVWAGGDCHIYDNHVDQVTEQLSRQPRPYPELVLAEPVAPRRIVTAIPPERSELAAFREQAGIASGSGGRDPLSEVGAAVALARPPVRMLRIEPDQRDVRVLGAVREPALELRQPVLLLELRDRSRASRDH